MSVLEAMDTTPSHVDHDLGVGVSRETDLERDPLGLTAEQMRDIGYRTVDMLAERLTDPSLPAMSRGIPSELQRRLNGSPPSGPRDWSDLLGQLEEDVLGTMSRHNHPGYFAFIPTSSTFPGALGDLIASALDIHVSSWMSAAGPSRLEVVVLDWFKDWIGYPADAAGVLVSGGSAANMTALACAREALIGPMSDRVVAYVGDQTHSSVARAARLMGFRPDQVRVLPTDGARRLRLDALVGAIDADIENGRQPLIVVANAGSTNTGAIDPLGELAAICRQRGLWLHVDGAYGGFAALTERGAHALAGIELADSVTLDPHKWLYQPIECGCLLVREGHLLRQAFAINPDYLADARSDEVNFCDYGLQLTRTSRAIKVWLSFNHFGGDAFRDAIDRSMDLALLAERIVRDSPALELLSPASLGIICFRRRFDGVDDENALARLNGELVKAFEATGRGLVSTTRLHATYAIRLCVLNHTSGPREVAGVLDFFASTSRPHDPVTSEEHAGLEDEHADVRDGWALAAHFDEAAVRGVPLFAGLAADALALVLGSAREVVVDPGEIVIRRWHGTRHFYTIIDGTIAIDAGGEHRYELSAGDFFGELAALDWGAGFGYARTASARAVSPARLLVLAPTAFGELLRRAPAVERQVRAAARGRLAPS